MFKFQVDLPNFFKLSCTQAHRHADRHETSLVVVDNRNYKNTCIACFLVYRLVAWFFLKISNFMNKQNSKDLQISMIQVM